MFFQLVLEFTSWKKEEEKNGPYYEHGMWKWRDEEQSVYGNDE